MPDYEKPPVYVLTKDGMKERDDSPQFRPTPKPPVSLGLVFVLLLAIAAYFVSRSQWVHSRQHPNEQKQEDLSVE